MKRNTGHGHSSCSGHGHSKCPPMPANDVAKSRSTGCDIKYFPPIGDREVNVILNEPELRIPVEAEIKLPTFARDIKEIRKNVHLTQCKAVQELYNPWSATLFVEGFVHKNIQYIEHASGYVKDYNVNVPFKCYERVNLVNPITFPWESSKNSTTYENRELAKNGMEADRCNFGSLTYENFNFPIDCKLLYSTIEQWDILKDFDNWGRFNHITEKMTLFLGLRLTQPQARGLAAPGDAVEENSPEPENAIAKVKRMGRGLS